MEGKTLLCCHCITYSLRGVKTVFRKYDKRRMGKIEKSSLKSALREAGKQCLFGECVI